MNLSQILIVGPTELVILGVMSIILLFGAAKLPELAKSLGRSSGEYQKGRKESEKELKAQQEDEKAVKVEPSSKDADREKLEEVAKQLGIDSKGKSIAELKEAIKKAV